MSTKRIPDWKKPFFMNMCGAMDIGDSYQWITPYVAIGDGTSSYEAFDIIVNADYPNNHIFGKKVGRREETFEKHTCSIYALGMCDHDLETIEPFVDYLIPRLTADYKSNPICKILFHCFAGKSRSVTLCLAFLVEVMGMSFEDGLCLIKEKRPLAEPRPLFIETLRKRYENKPFEL